MRTDGALTAEASPSTAPASTTLVTLGPRREADREAMRQLICERGFEHAATALGQVVAVEVTNKFAKDLDDQLERTADQAEAVVLDALVTFARARGWKGRA